MPSAAMRQTSSGSARSSVDVLPSTNKFSVILEGDLGHDKDDEGLRGRHKSASCLPVLSMRWRIAVLLFVLLHAAGFFLVAVLESSHGKMSEHSGDTPVPYAWGMTKKGVWERRPLPFLSREGVPLTKAPNDPSLDLFASGVTKHGVKFKKYLPRL